MNIINRQTPIQINQTLSEYQEGRKNLVVSRASKILLRKWKTNIFRIFQRKYDRKTIDKIGRWMITAKGTRVEDAKPVTTISSLRDQRGVAKREKNIADERKFTTLKNRRGNAKLHYFDFVTTGGKKFVTTSTSDHPARVLPRPDA